MDISKVGLRFGESLYTEFEPPRSGAFFSGIPTLTFQLLESLQTLSSSSLSQ